MTEFIHLESNIMSKLAFGARLLCDIQIVNPYLISEGVYFVVTNYILGPW